MAPFDIGYSSDLTTKISPLIEGQVPDFVQGDHALFVKFLKSYYQFLEAGELRVTVNIDNLLLELETPSKIYFTQTAEGTTLTYRKQLFKSSSSVSGVIGAGTFEDEELLKLSDSSAQQLDEMNNDFFRRLYTYQNDQHSQTIPEMELLVMKNDVLDMNQLWHSLKFKNPNMKVVKVTVDAKNQTIDTDKTNNSYSITK